MLLLLLTVLKQVVTLFGMIAVGYAVGRMGKVDRTGSAQLSFLLLYVINPCCIFNSMQIELSPEIMGNMVVTVLLSFLLYGLEIIISLRLFRGKPKETRCVLQAAMVYSNIGFVGIPIVKLVLGNEAILYLTINTVVQNIMVWTHGASIMSGKMIPRRAVVNPVVPAFLAALLVIGTGIELPAVAGDIVAFLAGVNTPLAMLVIGVQMSSIKPQRAFTRPDVLIASGFRLIVFPLLAILTLYPLRPTFFVYCTLVIIMALPMAGQVNIFAQIHDVDVDTSSQMLFATTLLSVITLPVIATVIQSVASYST